MHVTTCANEVSSVASATHGDDQQRRFKPPYVCIYASQVAVCIGANKHKKVSEAVESMWHRIAAHSYFAALERNGMKTEDQNVTEIMARHTQVKGLVDRSLTLPCDSSDQVAENYGTVSRGLDDVDLCDEDKRLVDDVLKRNLYTTYGNVQEHGMLQHIRDKLGIRCRPDPAFYKQLGGHARGGVPWFVGGKIDAISEEGDMVIELKNRVNRLFNRAPFYEAIQVQTYLQLLDVDRGALVECLKTAREEDVHGGGGPAAPAAGETEAPAAAEAPAAPAGAAGVHVNVIPIRRDRDLWAHNVMPKLSAFVDFLLMLLADTRVQDRYLQSKRRSVIVLNHMAAWERSMAVDMA